MGALMAGLGHIAVGLAAGRFMSRRPGVRLEVWTAASGMVALSLGPDLDVVTFALGIPYEAPFGHRGASHSLCVALLLGGLFAALPRRGGVSRWLAFTLVAAVVASHGLLDALTDGGLGVALLWPFDDGRLFAPWRPIPVSPIGAGLVSRRGAYVMLVELVVFSPLWLWALLAPRRSPAS